MHQQTLRNQFERIEEGSSKNHRSLPECDRKRLFFSALCPSSHHKNRYPDILPFEKTRVPLENQGQEGSDYINANFIFQGKYISCQAPIFSTFGDFWRMIWEQKCSVIVMLTRLFESGKMKANIYWPLYSGMPNRFGDIEVLKLDEENYQHFILRRFLLTREKQAREVYQLHYEEWPDFGAPSSTEGIRELVNSTNYFSRLSDEAGPIVVHCSAGVGRSGSFIAIHHAIDMLDRDEKPSVDDLVKTMREERWGMVQTQQQYEFIHQAIRDHEETQLEANNLDTYLISTSTSDDAISSNIAAASARANVLLHSHPVCPSSSISPEPSPLPFPFRKRNWRNTSADQIHTMNMTFG